MFLVGFINNCCAVVVGLYASTRDAVICVIFKLKPRGCFPPRIGKIT